MALDSTHFGQIADYDAWCTCCERPLNQKRMVWLELDQRDNTFHARQDIPPEQSQGWFPFGQTCARKIAAKVAA